MRYRPDDIVALLDSTSDAATVEGLPDRKTVADALPLAPTTALVGVATQGGRFPPAWRRCSRSASRRARPRERPARVRLRRPRARRARAEHGAELRDLRKPPAGLDVPSGANLTHGATTILTVGSDCAIGKMTVVARARPRGAPPRLPQRVRADRPDRASRSRAGGSRSTRSSPTSSPAPPSGSSLEGVARGGEVLFVEGQGSLLHPAYSGVTLGLIHGSAPHGYVLCHQAGERFVDGDERFPIPPLARARRLHEQISLLPRPARVTAIALNTRLLDDDAARRAIVETEAATGLPADDPVRFGAAEACGRSDASATELERAAGCGEHSRRRSPPSAWPLRPARGRQRQSGASTTTPASTSRATGRSGRRCARSGMTSDTMTLHWDETTTTGFEGDEEGLLAPALEGRGGCGRQRHVRRLSAPLGRALEPGQRWPVRDVGRRARGRLPAGAGVRGHERVQHEPLREPAVRARQERLRGALRHLPARPRMTRSRWSIRRSSSGVSASRRGETRFRPTSRARARRTRSTGSSSSVRWYRSSGRSKPLMDGLDLHPYPIPQSLPFETGYPRTHVVQCREPAARLPGVLRRLQRHPAADGRPGAAAGQPERGRDPDDSGRRRHDCVLGVRERGGSGGDGLGGLPGHVVPQARRLLALRRRRDEGEHLQARRRDLPAGLAERSLLRRVRPEAVGSGVHRRALADRRARARRAIPLTSSPAARLRRARGSPRRSSDKVAVAARVAGAIRSPLTRRTPVR